MEAWELNEHRRTRLGELLTSRFNGNKAAMGKALGYSSGAFLRQMLDGERPITEKTMAKVHELPGCSGWLDAPIGTQAAPATEPAPPGLEQAIQMIAHALDVLSDQDREKAAIALVTLARAPDSPRAMATLLAALQARALAGDLGADLPRSVGLSEYALDLAKQLDAIPQGEARSRAHAAASLAVSIHEAKMAIGSATSVQSPAPAPRPVARPRKSR